MLFDAQYGSSKSDFLASGPTNARYQMYKNSRTADVICKGMLLRTANKQIQGDQLFVPPSPPEILRQHSYDP